MTNEQEIRAKSMELAIGLLGVLTVPKNENIDVENAALYVGDVAKLAESFEKIIAKASGG